MRMKSGLVADDGPVVRAEQRVELLAVSSSFVSVRNMY